MPKQDRKLIWAFIISLGLVFFLTVVLIFRKPPVVQLPPDRTGILRDSISLLTTRIEKEKSYANLYMRLADSLMTLPPKINIIYYEKKQFISRATINQLDSIIRTSAGIPVRASY